MELESALRGELERAIRIADAAAAEAAAPRRWYARWAAFLAGLVI
jgi:hypothetical protein